MTGSTPRADKRLPYNLGAQRLAFASLWCRLPGAHSLSKTAACAVGVFMKRREMIRGSVLAGAVVALRPSLAAAQSAGQALAPSQASELTPAQSGMDASKD